MIRNSRQAATARRKRNELLHAAERSHPGQESGYLELVSELGQELSEYEAIRNGQINEFNIDGIDSLGDALVKARLARGWSHRQLATVLGVSEQMIQKDESRGYERAGLARIAEIADGLGYQLMGYLSPTHLPPSQWRRASTQISTSTSVPTGLTSWHNAISVITMASHTGAVAPAVAYADAMVGFAVPVNAVWLPRFNISSLTQAYAGSTDLLMHRLRPTLTAPQADPTTNTLSPAILVEETGTTP